LPVQAVVDEATGEFEQEVTLPGQAGAFDVATVVQEAVEDDLADGVVVVGLGRDARRAGAEGLAARAGGLVLCLVDVQPGDPAVSQGADAAVKAADAAALLAAVGAGVVLGGAVDGTNQRHEHGLCSWRTG
jgi:hypothetical protein